MFANDKNIDNLQQLLAELKKYAELQKDYVKLHLVEKLTILISTLILAVSYTHLTLPTICSV